MKIEAFRYKGYEIEIHKEEDPGTKFVWTIKDPDEFEENSYDDKNSLFNSVKAATVNAVERVNEMIIDDEYNEICKDTLSPIAGRE